MGGRRVIIVLVTWLAVLCAAAGVGIYTVGGDAYFRGRSEYPQRSWLADSLVPWTPEQQALPRSIVWLGDSTIILGSYPQALEHELARSGIRSRVVGWLGLNVYGAYLLTPAVLERLHPDVLVLIAYLRLFQRQVAFTDLASYLPLTAIPAALTTPVTGCDLPLPRLMLMQMLKSPAIEQLFFWWVGGRALACDAANSPDVAFLGPRWLPGDADNVSARRARYKAALLRGTDVAITASHPAVRMLSATVELATRRGVSVLVIGTPIPYEMMAEATGYDRDVFADRYRILREAVETAGGRFADLHEGLRSDDFLGPDAHFTPSGVQHMVDLVRPHVLAAFETREAMSQRSSPARRNDGPKEWTP